jgi:hypothetical protein
MSTKSFFTIVKKIQEPYAKRTFMMKYILFRTGKNQQAINQQSKKDQKKLINN